MSRGSNLIAFWVLSHAMAEYYPDGLGGNRRRGRRVLPYAKQGVGCKGGGLATRERDTKRVGYAKAMCVVYYEIILYL